MAVSIKNKIKTLYKLIKEPKVLGALLSQRYSGYLIDIGWLNSFKTNRAVDKYNNPIPWVTYPFIDFIEGRLNRNLSVLEFGSGNSTIFFSQRVKKVKSIEPNLEWINELQPSLTDNAEVIHNELNINYYLLIKNLNEKFNVVLVDGSYRVECIKNSLDVLTNDGVIILDDSERLEYYDGISFLQKKGFKKIDFWGIAPGILFKKCTTIFYRTNNCLGI